MKIKIQSGEEISPAVIQKIEVIFRESNCPNESFRLTFDDFKSFDGRTIQLGDGDKFVEYLEV